MTTMPIETEAEGEARDRCVALLLFNPRQFPDRETLREFVAGGVFEDLFDGAAETLTEGLGEDPSYELKNAFTCLVMDLARIGAEAARSDTDRPQFLNEEETDATRAEKLRLIGDAMAGISIAEDVQSALAWLSTDLLAASGKEPEREDGATDESPVMEKGESPDTAAETDGEDEEPENAYPVKLEVLPPPAQPLTREACVRWLHEECADLIEACCWGFVFASNKETREAMATLQRDAQRITQAAAETVALGTPRRPIALDTNPLDWPSATADLAGAVRCGLEDRPGESSPEPPPGFNVLAIILEERVKLDGLSDAAREETAARLTYPMCELDARA
jgi:hypothetical protein